MSLLEYIIRNMARNDIDIAIDWAAIEGWNPGLYDGDSFYEADPKGFFIGELNHEPIATISAVKFIKSWLSQPESNALGILQNDTLSGYGVIRKCRSGYKIRPLFANNPDLAKLLFHALTSGINPVEPIYFDTPEVNREAVALAEGNNMKPVFETAGMYTMASPDIPLHRVFGVTSFELG